MKKGRSRLCRIFSAMLAVMLTATTMLAAPLTAQAAVEGQTIVLTLGADLSQEQVNYIMQYFGVTADQVQTVTITNEDEREQLGNLVPLEQIGTRTVSCALVNPTTSGGIQVKTANLNYVTSNMIASTLVTSGVVNCEVLTAAPFVVSGTGALTGVMMAYETASGQALDDAKKDLANEELVTTGEIADTVGQDQATLVVNDIKIHIVRDGITDQQAVNTVVDEVIDTTQNAAAAAAAAGGSEAPAQLGEEDHQRLYQFGYKIGQMHYNYSQMQVTLERVTRNVTKATGIDDPITDTFTTTEADDALASDSILLHTDDAVMGEDANINATNSTALGDHPAEELDVYTGDVTLTDAGTVKADGFIASTNLVAYQDLNGSYALMDLNGNVLTDPVYTDDLSGSYGLIEAELNDGSFLRTVLDSNGNIVVPASYQKVDILGSYWAVGENLTDATEEDYDYSDYNGHYYKVTTIDFYTTAQPGTRVMTMDVSTLGPDYRCFQDYLSLEGADGTATVYDTSGTAVAVTDSVSDFSAVNADGNLSQTLSDATGYYVGSLQGNYLPFTDYSSGLKGILDRYGNVIVPAQLDSVYTSLESYAYEAGGYFEGVRDGHFQYLISGGTVTGDFAYDGSDVLNYGMAAKVNNEDGSVTLLSADGVETSLGTTYSYVSCVRSTDGLLWEGSRDGGEDLLDWHGNVLVEGAGDISVSANGHYVIARTGYTSSTLYLVDDASPVTLSETAGGATELEVTVQEGASLEPFQGDVPLQELGQAAGYRFVDGTDLIRAQGDNGNLALFDLAGHQLTDYLYTSDITARDGWLILTDAENGMGLFTDTGLQAIPCQYDYMEILGEHWAIGYHLTQEGAGKENNDFYNVGGDAYYLTESADVYHLEPDAVEGVTLTADALADADAEGEYINIEDRSSGAVTTYDSTFTAVASASYVSDFGDYSQTEVLARKLRDQTGYSVSGDFTDGYARIDDYSKESGGCGIVDMSGNIVVPMEYDSFLSSPNAEGDFSFISHGYFCAKAGDRVGYVTAGGNVTCELQYDYDAFYNTGAAGSFEAEDGSRTLVSADGVETTGWESLRGFAGGLLWGASRADENILVDWHGKELASGFSTVDVSDDGRYVIIGETYSGPYTLYGVNGATIEEAVSEQAAAQAVGTAAAAEEEQTQAATEAETEPAPTEAETETAAAQTEAAEQTETVAQTEAPEQAQTEAPEQTETAAQTEAAEQTETVAQTEAPEQTQTEAPGDANRSAAKTVIESALTLLGSDPEASRASAITLLQSARTLLEAASPDAAALVGSAITLLETGSTDFSSIETLLTTAQGMLG